MMPQALPETFLERLKKIVPPAQYERVAASFSSPRALTVRINTLKTSKEDIIKKLREKKVEVREILEVPEALILENVSAQDFGKMKLEEEGLLYRQGLSSMLVPAVLDPRPGEYVLDMCAAPGSKATQMAARMKNQGELVCLESVRGRYYKLKNVLRLMGVNNVSCHFMDARRFRTKGRFFDKILVDAPCSSEGRFRTGDSKTFCYWSSRKIKEMVRKQRGLLLSASRLLRNGGTLVYSTCTFAPEENEGVVDWLLKKTGGTLESEEVSLKSIERYTSITQWEKKQFHPQTKKSFRVLPDRNIEGFFMAQLKKSGIDVGKR